MFALCSKTVKDFCICNVAQKAKYKNIWIYVHGVSNWDAALDTMCYGIEQRWWWHSAQIVKLYGNLCAPTNWYSYAGTILIYGKHISLKYYASASTQTLQFMCENVRF